MARWERAHMSLGAIDRPARLLEVGQGLAIDLDISGSLGNAGHRLRRAAASSRHWARTAGTTARGTAIPRYSTATSVIRNADAEKPLSTLIKLNHAASLASKSESTSSSAYSS